jgi:hypothetical protein
MSTATSTSARASQRSAASSSPPSCRTIKGRSILSSGVLAATSPPGGRDRPLAATRKAGRGTLRFAPDGRRIAD